ncbi:hypothetical protein [Lentzea sp. NPDC051838]|uniref:hypothetical protein n=1 Tax=Lentzea sp. NPDC051838 TaxID=3154849 RepID=UPI00342771D2
MTVIRPGDPREVLLVVSELVRQSSGSGSPAYPSTANGNRAPPNTATAIGALTRLPYSSSVTRPSPGIST